MKLKENLFYKNKSLEFVKYSLLCLSWMNKSWSSSKDASSMDGKEVMQL